MPFKSDISALILGALSSEPAHGYEIVRHIRKVGGAEGFKEGQIYPYLHRLEEDGFVTAEWQTDLKAAPRKVYQLTEKGHKELAKHRSAWEQFAKDVTSLLGQNLVAQNA